MKIIHAAVSMNPSSGVLKQMEWEQQAAVALGLPWTTVLHTPKSVNSTIAHVWFGLPENKFLRYISLRFNFYRWLEKISKDYDLVILRFSVHDVGQAWLSKRVGDKLITVHHTKEEPELAGQPKVGKFKEFLEKILGRFTLANAVGFIAVTPEIRLYELQRIRDPGMKPSWLYPNGILMQEKLLLDSRGTDIPEIIFVASEFSPWQGLDKLIDNVLKNQANCIIHIVGAVSLIDKRRCKDDVRFIFHGNLEKNELFELMGRAWCGLSSFALERKEMQQACTLKVREYLAMGLPVYAGHQDTGFPDDFAFFNNGLPDLNDILNYARQMRDVSRPVVSAAAEPYISKINILSNLYARIQNDFLLKSDNSASESN